MVADYLQCFTQYVKQELKRSGVAAPDIDNAQWYVLMVCGTPAALTALAAAVERTGRHPSTHRKAPRLSPEQDNCGVHLAYILRSSSWPFYPTQVSDGPRHVV